MPRNVLHTIITVLAFERIVYCWVGLDNSFHYVTPDTPTSHYRQCSLHESTLNARSDLAEVILFIRRNVSSPNPLNGI
jgi:hypothetical protein